MKLSVTKECIQRASFFWKDRHGGGIAILYALLDAGYGAVAGDPEAAWGDRDGKRWVFELPEEARAWVWAFNAKEGSPVPQPIEFEVEPREWPGFEA